MTVSPAPLRSVPGNYVHHTAIQAAAAGISVVPIRADGTKQPSLSGWHAYQQRRASELELARWFHSQEPGIALITGTISGNLEALDFDDQRIFEAWLRRVQQNPVLAPLYDHVSWGHLEATPAGGRHLLYRCAVIKGNQKLASRPDGDRRKTLDRDARRRRPDYRRAIAWGSPSQWEALYGVARRDVIDQDDYLASARDAVLTGMRIR